MTKLEINIADMTKIPPYVAQLLLKQKGIIELGTICKGKKIDDCWYVIEGDKEKISAIGVILKTKGIRNKLKEVI